jgi:hypothetical protein
LSLQRPDSVAQKAAAKVPTRKVDAATAEVPKLTVEVLEREGPLFPGPLCSIVPAKSQFIAQQRLNKYSKTV